jgi:NRPS condensation-like uncharacterized protein
MDTIPGRFPTSAIDKIISSGQDIGIADFMLQMELIFKHELDIQRLTDALKLMLDAQPILGCRLVTERNKIYWERLNKPWPDIFFFTRDQEVFDTFRDQPLDSRQGPQINACLLRSAEGDRLLLKVSHLVCDSAGLNDIAAQLSQVYAQLADNSSYRPQPNIRGIRHCGQIMRHLPWHIYPALIIDFLRTTLSNQIPKKSHALQVTEGPRTPFTFISRHLLPAQIAHLAAYGRKHHATINDLMIAAFFRALATMEPWDGHAALRIQTTVDLRRWYIPSGKAEGICNLSTYEYINLGTELGADFAATLSRVSSITRRKKSSRIGLSELCTVPVAGLIPYNLLVKACNRLLHQRISSQNYPSGLTNLGLIQPGTVYFDSHPVEGCILPPVVYPPVLYIGFSGYGTTLTLSAGVPLAAKECIEQFFDQMLKELPTEEQAK